MSTDSTSSAPALTEGGGQSTQPAEMAPEHQAALKEVDRLRGEYGKAPAEGRDALTQRISKLQRFAFGLGEKPADFMPIEPPPPDTRPHDPMREIFEAAAKPASEQQMKAAIDNVVVQGVRRELAQEAAAVCGELQLSEGHAKGILDRVRAHHGAKLDAGPDSSFAVLSEAEVSEYASEASRLLGSSEKLAELSARAREFLAARGVLEKFDKSRLTQSSLAFDPKLLHTLAMAADMAGIPRGKR